MVNLKIMFQFEEVFFQLWNLPSAIKIACGFYWVKYDRKEFEIMLIKIDYCIAYKVPIHWTENLTQLCYFTIFGQVSVAFI